MSSVRNDQSKRSDNDGNRRSSRRLSNDAVPVAATPADPSLLSTRLSLRTRFATCDAINGLGIPHFCDGCQRYVSKSRKDNKPRHEILSKSLQCLQIWKVDEAEVPKRHVAHYNKVMEAIRNHERINPTALVEQINAAATPGAACEATALETTETPATTTTTKQVSPNEDDGWWYQPISIKGKIEMVRIPTTHKLHCTAHASRRDKEIETLQNIRKKMISSSFSTNALGKAALSIACASVPALALSAAQCLFPIIFYSTMIDTGLFNYPEFVLAQFATAFPSDCYLRQTIVYQAGQDLMALGKRLRDEFVPLYMACDKGNKRGISHFVKFLTWFDSQTMTVSKQLLDIDASDGTSADCALAIKHSLMKIGQHLLSGQCTDSGGGGVLEGLAKELEALDLCTADFIISACSIHALQLQLSNAVKKVIGQGGLDKRNALQMLHTVYDLQESIDTEEWRHVLRHATLWCIGFDDETEDDHFFVVAYKKVKQMFAFKLELIDDDAKMKGTILEKIQAPVLSRWWTVGKGAEFLLDYYLPILRACQILCNRYKSSSRPNIVASAMCSLMTNEQNFADLVLIKCFNSSFIQRHLEWMMTTVDLSEVPGFQAHNMAVRFFIMKDDLDNMFHQTFKGFEDYRQVVSSLDDDGQALQQKKEDLFVKESHTALDKHFPRWLSPDLFPAALLSEESSSVMVACCIVQFFDYARYFHYGKKFFYSEVHDRRIEIRPFTEFLLKYSVQRAEYPPEVQQAALLLLEGNDLRWKDLSVIDSDEEKRIWLHMFKKYLPLPSHTQFVEFGVKEALNVSTTNRSEEVRSACSIVRSAHVTDAGNSKTGSSNVEMIVNRINAAINTTNKHSEWRRTEDNYDEQMKNIIRLLKHGHFKSERINKRKIEIDATANVNKRQNRGQQPKEQQLTAAVTGHVLFSLLVQRLHMDDLKLELMHRNVPENDIPESVTNRKNLLKDLEVERLKSAGMKEEQATKIGRKQFEVLSEAEFEMESG